jgi:hypothetical protein
MIKDTLTGVFGVTGLQVLPNMPIDNSTNNTISVIIGIITIAKLLFPRGINLRFLDRRRIYKKKY